MTKSPGELPSHATNVRPAAKEKPRNESWPPPEVARKTSDAEPHMWIGVRVRLEFETGEEIIEGWASRWINRGNMRHVYVTVLDKRLHSGGVWVDPSDITRR